jgi:signal peptidase
MADPAGGPPSSDSSSESPPAVQPNEDGPVNAGGNGDVDAGGATNVDAAVGDGADGDGDGVGNADADVEESPDADADADVQESLDGDAVSDGRRSRGGESSRPSPEPGSSAASGGADPVGEAWTLLVDVARVVAAVAVLGATMWALTGVWPPLVAVESSSMSPNMRTGDLVVVTAPERYAPRAADATGVVTAESVTREGYRRFGATGDVVVFAVPGQRGSPIIHRARFHVAAGENWYDRADPAALPPGYDDCEELPHCPAPHAGYVTKGDHNDYYDQTGRIPPVRAEWVRAKAAVRVPWLGWVRLVIGGRL